jgi:hypothetical protein
VPDYEECTEYEVGTLLHTKVPRFRTNATIFDVLPDDCFQVVTDIGNVLNVSRSTLEEAMKKENAMENIAATAEQVFRLL